ncbi:MAG: hypothetical protein ACFFE8_16845 [Candidatus Heimdallarchaeota archaeon]
MSRRNWNSRFLPLIPAFLGSVLTVMGLFSFFSSINTLDQLLGGFLIIPGLMILIYSYREFKYRRKGVIAIRHDERSEINRLKAADGAFRFFFVSLAFLILINGIGIIDEVIFVALTGPIVAVGIIIYYIEFYWAERRG